MRTAAYRVTSERAVSRGWCAPGIEITELNHWVLENRRTTWNVNHPHGDAPWELWDGILRELARNVDRFAFAIQHRDHLCGLARGHLSGAGEVIALDYVEGNPHRSHPLKGKVIQIAVAVADAYGALVGARMLRLMKPTEALVGYYTSERFGFRVVNQGGRDRYCEREIQP